MKMFKATIEAITMTTQAENVIRTRTEIVVPANDRHDAVIAALDMGQAMARSANKVKDLALYFRVMNVTETNEKILGGV